MRIKLQEIEELVREAYTDIRDFETLVEQEQEESQGNYEDYSKMKEEN